MSERELVIVEKSQLDQNMLIYIGHQYIGKHAPIAILTGASDWTVTDDIEVVRAYKPVHECATCREALAIAERHLQQEPGRWVAIADVQYTCVWK